MSEQTKIEWCDSTWNPVVGCTKVGPGCDNCYAEGWAKRSGSVQWGPHAARRRTSEANWRQPLKWDREHEAFFAEHGRRRRVFCASLADVFDNAWDSGWRIDLFTTIRATPHLDWLLLTKRIGNVEAMVDEACGTAGWPANAWLGITVVNQDEADRDIPKLLRVPAPVRFLSMEPLLGPVDLTWCRGEPFKDAAGIERHHAFNALGSHGLGGIHWVIVGGESGPKARPMHPQWARDLRDQCAAAGVPFLFKQWGEWADMEAAGIACAGPVTTAAGDVPDWMRQRVKFDGGREAVVRAHTWTGHATELMYCVSKKAAGRLLDGREHNGFPG